METTKLKKFAQAARTDLRRQVETKLIQVLHASSAARREIPQAVAQLERQIQESNKEQVIEKVAYTWFNRFCALRFLDANGFTNPRVLTPMEGQITPEILAEAKMGHLDDELVAGKTREKVLDLLAGNAPSSDPQGEAYRQLLVSVCNHWYRHMPFLFEQINDYTELLMPGDLLSQGSIITSLREVMTEEVCQDVEVIGWLYQYYIAEKKDEVFAGLKKNIKITPENIPAATQLFTPHWIVRYLVENSLGRLWLLNRPQSKLAEKMDYYIAPEESEKDFLRISSPEEIRVCDPACGSGHMLTYAFDLLYAIYEEEGYDPTEIPALILTHNLYGVEIDDRAGALAAFALVMRAAARLGRRRFLRMQARPNICVLQNVSFTQDERDDVVAIIGRDLFTDELRETLMQFEQVKNFGSLIVPKLRDPAETLRAVEAWDFGGDLLLREVQERLVTVLRMAEALSPKYHVVVANPPYAGFKGLNADIQNYLLRNYPSAKVDLYSAFIERGSRIVVSHGFNGMVTMESWMFLSSFEDMRAKCLESNTLHSMVHMPYLGKGRTSMGISFGTTAFILEKARRIDHVGDFCCLRYFESDDHGVPLEFPPRNERLARASTRDFEKLPGEPIAYWVSEQFRKNFADLPPVSEIFTACQGLSTSDNPTFVRQWSEVSVSRVRLPGSDRASKWSPYNKGGEFRRWSGNQEHIVDWEENGRRIKALKPKSVIRNESRYFQPSISWSDVTSSKSSFRKYQDGFIFANNAHSVFPAESEKASSLIALLNSKVIDGIIDAISPAMHFDVGYFSKIPFQTRDASAYVNWLVNTAKSDWDSYETSWDFTTLSILSPQHWTETLNSSYARLRTHWQGITDEMQRLEEENNRIFIDAYGLQNELNPGVPVEEITLTCNPAYRYGVKVTEDDREKRLLSDTMAEFISYAVGCMFGRYSLDKPGLVLANQGDTLAEYLQHVPEPRFMPDNDNVIPVLDGEWFADDVTERFRQFLRVTFGDDHYEENLAFIEKALGKVVRKYFLKDFYVDHLKRYKKRPIYWLFSSPKGTFSALIYLHRYRPDTVSVVLKYLRDFRDKLAARLDYLQKVAISPDASQSEKTKASKEADTIKKQLLELDDYEREILYPLAQKAASGKLNLDLDDGVKVNYLKLEAALKKIPGLEAKED
ncbi:BREX-1 system adenine-specific DNA-methyltransferase PglX [Pseudomonas putida]|uniref:BREX-1 system adenine-specific DNA-methyltransferase PglX n=1 Tax=Pseudomonas TaxID=286 RepID=UPI002835CFC6|nr:BREX-1 system adenine-specific DNA-methyltransferase PglX [Pseudomonas aeruginosa]EKU9150862.1 BREX-1 system adenine-specific DNA-methyltransferase PglX [Pseudomonas aeruginosa]ELB4691384.1 BREX-1 system adenine-specific DNA-methyltransferase PglX [Pseudomonas aeruginosa]